MVNFERFRREAKENGLIVPIDYTPAYRFQLDAGSIYTPQNPEAIWKLVILARDYADGDNYGEHIELLNLRTIKSSLNDDVVIWGNMDHLQNADEISLESYLRDSRFNFNLLQRDPIGGYYNEF